MAVGREEGGQRCQCTGPRRRWAKRFRPGDRAGGCGMIGRGGALPFPEPRPAMTTRFALAAVAAAIALPAAAAEPARRPNILFIFADDQSYKTVGCYPESWPWVKTPNID